MSIKALYILVVENYFIAFTILFITRVKIIVLDLCKRGYKGIIWLESYIFFLQHTISRTRFSVSDFLEISDYVS